MKVSSVPMLLMFMFMFMMFPISSYAYNNTCPTLMNHPLFMFDFKAQCPTNIIYSSPIQMDGESLDKVLSSSETNAYVAILFYASWCPFSKNVQPKFDALSSMYPQIKHIMVEQSSVLPIVFSRYGIHGVPSILLVNKTTRMRHRGPKEMQSLVNFYQRATGLEPTMYLTEDQIIFSENKSDVLESLNKTQIKDIISREPYLIFSLFFLFLKALVYFYPNMISNLIALWLAYIPHPNLAIFGESKQLLARVLHLVDVNRAFNKLKLIKSRPFHNGARSARAWTSSLASFSLSKTSSSRASQGVKL
ncbi:Thioredoxin domain-containing protein [Artemisia annua]|uniref:Thioredoxin domain-containing protein n=1 Tax=Artemisia annua TaxID=35608 RepID=A0A2U1M6C5_ARTAN|nr:Thioredoxin domain-containing protein [Artemisia annua]